MLKKLMFSLMFILLTGLVSASSFNIEQYISEWTPTHVSGEETNLTFWSLNAKDKKTELGWIPKSGSCVGQSDKSLTYFNGSLVLDDKAKPIILKCESGKCGGQSCYHISLTNAQAINIDDELKLGLNSYAVKYQNQSYVRYVNEIESFNNETNETFYTYNYEVNTTLKRNSSDGFVIRPEEVFIKDFAPDKFKFGAFDTGATKDERYQYTFDTDAEIWEYRGEYFIGGELLFYSTNFFQGTKLYDTNHIDLSDICVEEANCTYVLNNTYEQVLDEFNETMNGDIISSELIVEFTGFHNDEQTIFNGTHNVTYYNTTFIDPAFKLGDMEWGTTTAYLSNTSYIKNGVVVPVSVDLVALYHLDVNGTINDSSGNGLTGNNDGSTYTASGKFSGAYDFDGVDDYIIINDSNALDLEDQITISGWYYIYPSATANDGNVVGLISKSNTAVGSGGWFIDFDDRGGAQPINGIRFYTFNGGVTDGIVEVNNTITSAGWYHIVGVFDESASSDTKLYVNGVLKGSDNMGDDIGVNALDVYIGRMSGTPRYADIIADDVSIHSRALSAKEIYDLYESGVAMKTVDNTFTRIIKLKDFSPSNTTGLISDYDLSGTTAGIDKQGNNNGTYMGTLVNCNANGIYELYGDSCNFDVTTVDVDNRTIYFNTTNGYNTSTGAMEFWFKIDDIVGNQGSYLFHAGSMHESEASGTKELYEVSFSNSDQFLKVAFYDNGGWQHIAKFGTDTTISANNWYHLVVNKEVEDEIEKVYLNGVELPFHSFSVGSNVSFWFDDFDHNDSLIGSRFLTDTSGKGHMKGNIARYRYYNRPLSTDEIYNNSLARPTSTMYINESDSECNVNDKVLWMHLDRDVQSIADFSGEGNTGTRNGTIFNSTGQIGGAMMFEGVDDYIAIGTSPILTGLSKVSISAWVKTSDDGRMFILGEGYNFASQIEMGLGGDGRIGASFTTSGGSSTAYTTTDDEFNDGDWHYVVGIYNSTHAILYVDGVLEATGSATTGTITGTDRPAVGAFINSDASSIINYFNGSIDEPIIYNKALTADEINASYQAGLLGNVYNSGVDNVTFQYAVSNASEVFVPNSTGVVGHWSLNETGATVLDSSGNGNNGTITNAVFSNYCANNMIGCRDFDGIGDYITIGTTTDLQFGTGDFSISTWFRAGDQNTAYSAIFDRGWYDSPYTGYHLGVRATTGLPYFAITESNIYQLVATGGLYGTTDVTDEKWHHIVAVRNGAEMYMYLDGILHVSASGTLRNVDNAATKAYIGTTDHDGSPTLDSFNGTIDETIIYNRSLGQSEIYDLYTRTKPSDFNLSASQSCGLDTDLSNITGTTGGYNVKYVANLDTSNVSQQPQLNYINFNYNNVSGDIIETFNITIISPENNSIWYTTFIDFLVSASQTVSTWWYNLNGGTNITFSPNITINVSTNSSYELTVYANNTEGNITSAKTFFNTTNYLKWIIHSQYYPYNVTWIDETGTFWTYGYATFNDGVTINEELNMTNGTIHEVNIMTPYIDDSDPTPIEGGFWYENGNTKKWCYYLRETGLHACIGDSPLLMKNDAGTTIPKCKAVYPKGASGNRITVDFACANCSEYSRPIGVTMEESLNGQPVWVMTSGDIHDTCDTRPYNPGDHLYLTINPQDGNLTTSQQSSPYFNVHVADVLTSEEEGDIRVDIYSPYNERFSVENLTVRENAEILNNLNVSGDLKVGSNITLESNTGIITGEAVYGEIWIEGSDKVPITTYNLTTTMTGNATNLSSIDESYTLLDETVGDGFEQIYSYNGGITQDPGSWSWTGYYFPGNAGHTINVRSWNGTAYETLCNDIAGDIYTGNDNNINYVCQFPNNSSRFLNNGWINISVWHDTPGSNSHVFASDGANIEPKDITFTNAGTYYKAEGFTDGLNKYVTINGINGNMTIQYAGDYKVCVAMSFRGTPNTVIHGDVFINGIEQDNIAYTRKLGSGGDVGSAGMCGLLNLNDGDVIDLRFKSDNEGAYIQFENGNFNIQRLN